MATVVGVPKEVKEQEGRVWMQPDGVAELGDHGHDVFVQAAAGEGAGFEDQGYVSCGARVVETADEVFEAADLIVKVKEPVPEEYDRFHEGQELFTYLHLAADKELTEYLMDIRAGGGAAPGEHAGLGWAPSGWQPRLRAGRRGP